MVEVAGSCKPCYGLRMVIFSPVRAATAGTVVVGALSFSLSFSALSALAADNGVGQAWMLPLVVDGGMIVATAATIALRRSRWFAWMLMILSSAVSVAGNVAHAPGSAVAMVIAAIPAVWLLAATHLTVMLVHQDADDRPVAYEPRTDTSENLNTPPAGVQESVRQAA